MGKLKTLREARASVFTQIDELRTAADGREMTAEEQARWNQLLSDYDKADKAVKTEERYGNIEVALKAYGGMFEAGTIILTSTGGDLIMPTVNDSNAKVTWATTKTPSLPPSKRQFC